MRIFKDSCLTRWGGYLLAILTVFAAGRCWGAETTETTDPLLDLFVKKGYVTQEEADKVKAEADRMRTNEIADMFPEASKWKISNGIKDMGIFGDVRLRYEARSATDPAGNKISDSRFRYSVRVGLKGDLFDDFYYGFRLETSSNPRSAWGTFGSASPGPFGKSTSGIAVGQAYLGWRPEDWVDITLGKMPNPLYTTPLVWDTDLNPEGLAERFKCSVGEADFFANFGQFLYGDFNPSEVSGGLGINGLVGQNTENIFLFAWQGGLKYHITQNVSAKIAATLYNYAGLQRSSANSGSVYSPYYGDPYVGEGAYYYYGGVSPYTDIGNAGYSPGTTFNLPNGGYGSVGYPFNQVGLNNLQVLEIPFEFDFKLKKVAVRTFGDFAYNLDGAQRAQDAANAYNTILTFNPSGSAKLHSFPAQTHDVKAYQFGIGIGSTNLDYGPSQGLVYGNSSRKHAWECRVYYQHIEQYALDPNLIDSDFFEGRENMEGIYAAISFAFTDNLFATVRYGYARRINDLLGTGGSNSDIPQMNPINHYNLLQVDVSARF